MANMKNIIIISILAFILTGCSASEPQHEYYFAVCSNSPGLKPIYDASVKLLELYPTDPDSSITPPEFTIDRDSLASMVFYPPVAVLAGIEGTVVANFLVDDRGYTNDIKIESGILTIANYAVNNVLCMARFNPAMKNGAPVPCNMTAVFEFNRGELLGYEDR